MGGEDSKPGVESACTIHYPNVLLVRVRLSFQKLLQIRSTCRNNTKKYLRKVCWRLLVVYKSRDHVKPRFDLFYATISTPKKRANWHWRELRCMNCGKICFHFSNFYILLSQLSSHKVGKNSIWFLNWPAEENLLPVVTYCLRTYIGLRPYVVNVYILERINDQTTICPGGNTTYLGYYLVPKVSHTRTPHHNLIAWYNIHF